MKSKRKFNLNKFITCFCIGLCILIDVFYCYMCYASDPKITPSDGFVFGNFSFFGVELALNFGVYKRKKAVHMDSGGGITDAETCSDFSEESLETDSENSPEEIISKQMEG